MENNERLGQDELIHVADAIGKQLPYMYAHQRQHNVVQNTRNYSAKDQFSLGENLNIWNLNVTQIDLNQSKKIHELAQDTNKRHFQLYLKNESRMYVEIQSSLNKDIKIKKYSESELASEIDAALRFLKEKIHLRNEFAIRILYIPVFAITNLWLSSENEEFIVPVSNPSEIERISVNSLYHPDVLLKIISTVKLESGVLDD